MNVNRHIHCIVMTIQSRMRKLSVILILINTELVFTIQVNNGWTDGWMNK